MAMIANDVDIDRIVDYKTEYSRAIKKIKITGDRLLGLCPFHNDSNSSFSVNLNNGTFKCFACEASGNYTTFVSRQEGISLKEAYKKILRDHGIDQPEPEKKKDNDDSPLSSFTIAEYAFAKRLDEKFLTETCGLSTDKDRKGINFVKIPYFREDNEESTYRKRYGAKQFRWKWQSGDQICLYGEWRLPEMRDKGYAIMVEGESDTQTLWFLSFPALGVPGATNFKLPWVSKLQDLKLYLHIEPDMGGDTFLHKTIGKLREGEFIGEVYTWSCKQYGVKDPSELYLKYKAEEATIKIKTAINNAQKIDIYEVTNTSPIEGAPELRQPLGSGWTYSEKGISKINEKTGLPVVVCRTPILINRRLTSLETNDEKIEIAYKRDGAWRNAIFPRSTIFQSKSITCLADLGCTITSENAKHVVSFLSALEAENFDMIDKADSTRSFGWQTKNRFLPGLGDNIVLDIEPSQRALAAAYFTQGTLEAWIKTMKPHRNRYKFRFILATAFAAPLLKIIKQRIFFVYNWGNSKAGKTAGLKAALSAWGDPERLMANFNATQVALERMAAFYCDLPLGIDERQLAGSNQGGLEKIIYMIASGIGRARGNKSGGLQQTATWRTIAMATGEEPISTDTSQTGVSTRVIEIYGGPFDDEKDAAKMHQDSTQNYGYAGIEFIKFLIETPESDICTKYNDISKTLYNSNTSKSGAHVAGVAAVALADMYIDKLFFDGTDSEKDAMKMAEAVLSDQASDNTSGDVNENARQFILDWIMSNKNYFGMKNKQTGLFQLPVSGTCLGVIDESSAFIFPTLLNQALTKAGYSARKTMKYLGDCGYIAVESENKVARNSIQKKINGTKYRFVRFYLEMDEDEASDKNDGFMQVEYGQEELPF